MEKQTWSKEEKLPAPKLIRNKREAGPESAPRKREGTLCSVRTRQHEDSSRQMPSRDANPTRRPSSAARTRRCAAVPGASSAGRASAAAVAWIKGACGASSIKTGRTPSTPTTTSAHRRAQEEAATRAAALATASSSSCTRAASTLAAKSAHASCESGSAASGASAKLAGGPAAPRPAERWRACAVGAACARASDQTPGSRVKIDMPVREASWGLITPRGTACRSSARPTFRYRPNLAPATATMS